MNKRHHSGLSRNVHCLSTNPTLSQLSSLPSDQFQLHFASTEDLEIDNNCDFEPANDEKIDTARETTTVTSTSSIQRSINPPSCIKFGIHLHEILSSHRGVDLSLYDEIIDTIKFHSTVYKTDFLATELYHWKELTTTLSKLYQFNKMKPVMHRITISDGSVVTVPVFDVKAVLLSILHDPQRMTYENFAMNYDVFLGKPTQAVTHYNEIHTGNLWSTACDYYCSNDSDAFPLGLVCFYDKIHTDVFGALSCAPFIATFLFFNKHVGTINSFTQY